MRLTGRTALVTGASRGIGREIALELGREGAVLHLAARSREGLEETRKLLGDVRTEIICVDLREVRGIEQLARSAQDAGPIDVLVNAAGVWHDEQGKYHGPRLSDTPTGQIDEILEVGLRASFLLTRALLPEMIRRRSGKIVQISCGFAGPHDAIGWLHYYVTNKAIEAFTRGLAAELREFDVQVNCIAPWFVATEAVRQYYPVESQKALDPRRVADLAVFLASTESDDISGQIIELRSKADIG